MSSVGQETLFEQARARVRQPLSSAERRVEALMGGAFVVVVAALLALAPGTRDVEVLPAVLCVIGFAAALQVRFDVGAGITVPTQLAFVPMMFVVPAPLLPVAVAAAIALGDLPRVLRRERPPSRLLLALANSWFSVGPAVLLAIAGGAAALVAEPVLLAFALLAQFASDFLASSVREALVRGASLREQVGEAVWVYAVDGALAPVGYLAAHEAAERPWLVLCLVPLCALLGVFARERRARLESLLELHHAYRGTALVLGDVVEADDGYTGQHCKEVVRLALAVGDELGLPADRRRNLEFGALLHDVGKVAIPKEIINKPGKLNDEEWAVIKTHTIEGQRMLDRVGGFMREVGRIVRSHHERWDGGGYPDALAGEAIPLEARIVACCDAYNAMTTDRSYRAAMPVGEAMAEVERCAGAQFDPAVAAALTAVVCRDGAAATATARPSEPPAHLGWTLGPLVQADGQPQGVRTAVRS